MSVVEDGSSATQGGKTKSGEGGVARGGGPEEEKGTGRGPCAAELPHEAGDGGGSRQEGAGHASSEPRPAESPAGSQRSKTLRASAEPWFPKPPQAGPDTCPAFAETGRCGEAHCDLQHVPAGALTEAQRIARQVEREEKAIQAALKHDAEDRLCGTRGTPITQRTVYVIGIDSLLPEEAILNKMCEYGAVRKFQLCGDTRQATRYGFLEYVSKLGAMRALSFTGQRWNERSIKVSLAKEGIKGGLTLNEAQQIGILRATVRLQERKGHLDVDVADLPTALIQPFIQGAKADALLSKSETPGNDTSALDYSMPPKDDGASPPDTPIHPLWMCSTESLHIMLKKALMQHKSVQATRDDPSDDFNPKLDIHTLNEGAQECNSGRTD